MDGPWVRKRNPNLEKLEQSGIFRDSSAAAYAFNAYRNLRRSESGPLMVAKTGKSYTGANLPELLIDRYGVKPENKEKAMALLLEASR